MHAHLPQIITGVVFALAVGYLFFGRSGDVSAADAHRLVQSGALLLDVRTPQEFAAGHIDGAVNIPVQDLERRLGELEPKDRPIVLYCRSGNRSGKAARLLAREGHTSLHDLGAMSRW